MSNTESITLLSTVNDNVCLKIYYGKYEISIAFENLHGGCFLRNELAIFLEDKNVTKKFLTEEDHSTGYGIASPSADRVVKLFKQIEKGENL